MEEEKENSFQSSSSEEKSENSFQSSSSEEKSENSLQSSSSEEKSENSFGSSNSEEENENSFLSSSSAEESDNSFLSSSSAEESDNSFRSSTSEEESDNSFRSPSSEEDEIIINKSMEPRSRSLLYGRLYSVVSGFESEMAEAPFSALEEPRAPGCLPLPQAEDFASRLKSDLARCSQERGKDLVAEILDCFEGFAGEISDEDLLTILCAGLLEGCHALRLNDSQPIKNILNFYYEEFGSFHDFHLHALSKEDSADSQQPDFLSFYLEFARRQKLQYRGQRFIDAYFTEDYADAMYAAIDQLQWKTLLIYLQFGAKCEGHYDPYDAEDGLLTLYGRYNMTFLFKKLIKRLYRWVVQPAEGLPLAYEGEVEEYLNNLGEEVHHLRRTFEILLRALKFLPHHDAWNFVCFGSSCQHVTDIPTVSVISHPAVQKLLPTLGQRYMSPPLLQPAPLQHACRWVIRERLDENFQLPVGIENLDIPRLLKTYLNLKSD